MRCIVLLSLAAGYWSGGSIAEADCLPASHLQYGPAPLSRCADITYDCRYVGYYVGGGATPNKGECRYRHEGTWGVDYKPIVPGFRRGVILNWWHGRKYQDGGGTYEPDHANNPFKSYHRSY